MHSALDGKVQSVLHSFQGRIFVGVDVSTKVCAFSLLRLDLNHEIRLIKSDFVALPRDGGVCAKYDVILQKFLETKEEHDRGEEWVVVAEDVLMRMSTGAKGIIGLKSLGEILTVVQLATKQCFQARARLVNPRTARGGLGLNVSKGSSREAVKANVKKFVKLAQPEFFDTDYEDKFAEDRADAFILGLYAIRMSLNAQIAEDPEIVSLFNACHSTTPPGGKMLKPEVTHMSTELEKRVSHWVDELWFFKLPYISAFKEQCGLD